MTPLSKADVFDRLPPVWPENLAPAIRAGAVRSGRTLVVLDDDPTGTQTVADLPVLASWTVEDLSTVLREKLPCFYILTNSRALSPVPAQSLIHDVACRLKEASAKAQREIVIVARGDSTLRGHFPMETDVVGQVLGRAMPTLLIPYFEAGRRYTIEDVHYVQEGETLLPAAETPFARDAAFGFRSSNLRAYVEEKTAGRTTAEDVDSISLDELRGGGPDVVRAKLSGLADDAFCIVNAAAPRDLDVLALAVLTLEDQGRRFLFRSAAQFVAARLGLTSEPNWRLPESTQETGGLTVVGSHVPKSTAQLEMLRSDSEVDAVELRVDPLRDPGLRSQAISAAFETVRTSLTKGRDAVIFTSRQLVCGPDAASSLAIGAAVSDALVELVRRLDWRPRYLIAKGGITSSDIATRGLGMRRARVAGQILPGVPVWEMGPETRFPGLHYIVFPGNVGDDRALLNAVEQLKFKPSEMTL